LIKDFAAITPELAQQLGVKAVVDSDSLNESNGIFELVEQQLLLHLMLDGQASCLAIDLAEGEVANRATKVSKTNELIAKAIGCKPHYRPSVLDATAGMGRDSLIMAMLGCNVSMQERNRAIYLLLENALNRFKQSKPYQSMTNGQLVLKRQDSVASFDNMKDIDVIYLDPMFPERKKSALVKKEMRLFKLIAGDDQDADDLMMSALASNVKRIVVKRPKGAPFLANKTPSHEIKGKKFRFDVYLV